MDRREGHRARREPVAAGLRRPDPPQVVPPADVALTVSVEQIRRVALALPRTTEHLIHDRVKFRVGRIVYVALSQDEEIMGFGFPKEERDALIASDTDKFRLPRTSDLRYHWVEVRLAAIDEAEMRELVTDAWRMVVPKGVAKAHDHGDR